MNDTVNTMPTIDSASAADPLMMPVNAMPSPDHPTRPPPATDPEHQAEHAEHEPDHDEHRHPREDQRHQPTREGGDGDPVAGSRPVGADGSAPPRRDRPCGGPRRRRRPSRRAR